MLQIAICDDEGEVCREIEEYLLTLQPKVSRKMEFSRFSDVSILLRDEEKEPFDIILMDIDLPGENGVDAAIRIFEEHPATRFIFVTGHSRYSQDVFMVNPSGFVLKPVRDNQRLLERYFLRAVEICGNRATFGYRKQHEDCRMNLGEVCYFASDGRKIRIVTVRGEDEFYGKLNEVAGRVEQLDGDFLRVSQTELVNYTYIERFSPKEVTVRRSKDQGSVTFGVSYTWRKAAVEKYRDLSFARKGR